MQQRESLKVRKWFFGSCLCYHFLPACWDTWLAAVPSPEGQYGCQADRHLLLMEPSLMEQPVGDNADEHIIDIVRDGVASASTAHGCNIPNESPNEDGSSPAVHVPTSQSSSAPQTTSNSTTISSRRGGDNYGRRHRGPLNSGLWISIQLIINLSQITAASVVLFLSRPEQRITPLGAWVIGYTFGCVGTLPHLFWRYVQCNNQATGQDATNTFQNLSQNNLPGSNPSIVISVTHSIEGENVLGSGRPLQLRQNSANTSQRLNLNALVDCLKMAFDCFLVLWFLIGYFMLLSGPASASDAPSLYRLFIALLTFSFIWCAMPYILCAVRCCCLPCLTKRGASTESINSLPTCKFKMKRIRNVDGSEIDAEGAGGLLVSEIDKERTISAEDAVCCICIANYEDNDDLRELPCNHLFHMACVDEWLKINAMCPLCKAHVR